MESNQLKALKIAGTFLKSTVSGCVDRYVYGQAIAAMDDAISIMETHPGSVSWEKAIRASKNLREEADFLETVISTCPNRSEFRLVVAAMREASWAIRQQMHVNSI